VKKHLFMAALVVACAGSVQAQESGAWKWRITPYAWAMGVDGDMGAGGVTAPVDIDFVDVVDELDMAGMLAVEADNGTWGVIVDGSYLRLDDESKGIDVELEQWIIEGAALYRVSKSDKTQVSLGGGGRYIEQDLDLSAGGLDAEGTEGWGDPLLVLRVRQQFGPNCYGVLHGDIGGGIDGGSDLTWQAIATAGYAFTETVSGLLSYRYLDYDFDDNGFTYDAASSGIALGVQITL
jgi:opacity protein-like surface antigen